MQSVELARHLFASLRDERGEQIHFWFQIHSKELVEHDRGRQEINATSVRLVAFFITVYLEPDLS